jgi:hypothetical protein
MGGKNRRAVSISGLAYTALSHYAAAMGVSASSVVESYVRELCGLEPGRSCAPRQVPREVMAAPAPVQSPAPKELTAVEKRIAADHERRRERQREHLDEEAAIADPCRRIDCPHSHLHKAGACKGVISGRPLTASSFTVRAAQWKIDNNATAAQAGRRFGLSRGAAVKAEKALLAGEVSP